MKTAVRNVDSLRARRPQLLQWPATSGGGVRAIDAQVPGGQSANFRQICPQARALTYGSPDLR